MAPPPQDTLDALKYIVGDLQGRVAQLERRLPKEMRMILIGPPGAGMFVFEHLVPFPFTGPLCPCFFAWARADVIVVL